VVVSDNPPPAAFADKAQALGLQTTTTLGFPTMGRASDAQGGAARLVALKAVAPGYPLRGSLQVASADRCTGTGDPRYPPHPARPGWTPPCSTT